MSMSRRRAAAVVAALSSSLSAGSAAPGWAWWECDPGFNLERNGDRVRCVKPATVLSQSPTCPVGTTLTTNVVGHQDRCRAGGVFAADGPVLCSSGYTLDVEPGADKCRKHVDAQEKAPTHNVP
jgi:hypothetical protein